MRKKRKGSARLRVAAAILFIAVLAVGVVFGYAQIATQPVPQGFKEKTLTLVDVEGQKEPSLDMMLSHLKIMSAVPHVAGSEANRKVHSYLVEQLRAMGLDPNVEKYNLTPQEIMDITKRHKTPARQVEAVVRDYADMGDKATLDIQNAFVKLDAPGTDEGILFVSQYDSVKFGPGAGDNLSSTTALMEALRTQQEKGGFKNDVYVLFTDGEEQGLLGAASFVDAHPEMKDKIRFVMNIECRGNQGSMLMFEASKNNLEMVRHYKNAVKTPVSFSIATQVYQMMDNDTDLTEFMLDGYPGLNFATIEGADVYHSADDTFENFSRGTAAHYLETVSGLVDYAARADFSTVQSGEDGVFFPVLRGNLVLLSSTEARILAIAAAVIALFSIIWLLLTRSIKGRDILKVLGVQVGALAVSGLVSFAVVKIAMVATGSKTSRQYLAWDWAMPIFLILLVLGVLFTIAAVLWIGNRLRSPGAVLSGMMPLLMVLALGTAFAFNAASYLFSLPLLVLALYSFAQSFFPRSGPACATVGVIGFVLAGILTLLLFTPIVYLLYVAMAFPIVPAAVGLAAIPVSVLAAAFSALWQRPVVRNRYIDLL